MCVWGVWGVWGGGFSSMFQITIGNSTENGLGSVARSFVVVNRIRRCKAGVRHTHFHIKKKSTMTKKSLNLDHTSCATRMLQCAKTQNKMYNNGTKATFTLFACQRLRFIYLFLPKYDYF